MEEQDQTSEETTEKTSDETSEETAGDKEKSQEQTPKAEPDYKEKFRASQAEAIRLSKKVKELEAVASKKEPDENAEAEEAKTIDEIVGKKVEEKIAPFVKKQEEGRVDAWLEQHPEAHDYLKEIIDAYPETYGKSVEDKLENALLIAKKDTMKKSGKTEMAFAIYQQRQAIAGGGASAGSQGEKSLPSLTAAEKKVARSMGLTDEAYAKSKAEIKR